MSVSSNPVITVTVLPTSEQKAPQRDLQSPPSHHVGNPPTSFQNPWPSFVKHSRWAILQTRFSKDRNLIPVPPRDELVQIHKPDWGNGERGLKATWIGHASFLVETTANEGAFRGIRVLLDPVWSERTSPVQWFGPKR
jgi:N-acyl-phosphatidylethanolamine-hydrolysing phospholipase D